MRPMMIIDLLAFLPRYVHKILPFDFRALRLLRLFRLLKLIRYSPALQTLKRVVAHEWRALLGALLLMMMLLVFASTIIYFLERSAQPEHFGSIPASAWWTLETLTTVGYGDVTPMTPLGKVRRHRHAVWALHVRFARRHHSHRLQSEVARHEFVVTWSMVGRVPLFSTLDAAEVAEVTKLLYTRAFQPGRLDRVHRRARRRHVSDRQRRGHGLRGAPDTPSS